MAAVESVIVYKVCRINDPLMKYLHVSNEPVANTKKRKWKKKGFEEIHLHYHCKGDGYGTDVLFGNYG